jgi:prepilin-type N-terminal cleavage/methylation domain-containing protein
MKSRGFTLIELMIVVAIIAIIAAIAIPNLLRSRMAANESAAIAACKTFAEAQDIYRRTDWDSDGVLEYSLAISGNNSLYEKDSGSGNLTLVDAAFATAEGQPGVAQPKAGYVFTVLTGQGANAPGGTKTYVTGANMTLGYACSATPASYDGTGRNSFQINNTGTVYQKDQGSSVSTHITTYNPDTGWVVSE